MDRRFLWELEMTDVTFLQIPNAYLKAQNLCKLDATWATFWRKDFRREAKKAVKGDLLNNIMELKDHVIVL